jgi:hypothetical protein
VRALLPGRPKTGEAEDAGNPHGQSHGGDPGRRHSTVCSRPGRQPSARLRRLSLAAASALAYAGVAAYAVARTSGVGGLVAGIGAVGAALLAAVLVRGAQELLAWSLATLGAAYAVSLAVSGRAVDEAAPLVAAALLLCGELAAWSLDERWPIAAEAAVVRRRAVALGTLGAAGLVAAAAVIAVAAAPAGRGLAWTTLGAAAAVCAVGAGVAIARQADRRAD